MSDSGTNLEIEDVLSSIRRLVSEDRAAAGPVKSADEMPSAPMIEAVVQVESATVTHFLPRGGQANQRLAPGGSQADNDRPAESRIDAAIVSLNAETGETLDPVELDMAVESAVGPSVEELVDTSDLLAEPYQQAGAKGAQFVLTADFLVEASAPATFEEPEEAPEAPSETSWTAAPGTSAEDGLDASVPDLPIGGAPEPVQPSGRPDLSLDDLVSGDALLATFGSVGASPVTSNWDSDALADLAPRTAPRAYPLHPTLEATIADLEMAVAAQSEEFEPDQGEDMGDALVLDAAPVFVDQTNGPTDAPVQVAGNDMSEWEAAEAVVEAVQPLRRHRLHLNAAAATGYIGISDAFPAEDQDAPVASLVPAPAEEHAAPEAQETFDQTWASEKTLGEDYIGLPVEGSGLDLEDTTDEILLGMGDAIDAPRLPVETDDLIATELDADARAGEAEGYADPAIESERDLGPAVHDQEPAVVATPARRIFIAPRTDLSEAEPKNALSAEEDVWARDAQMADAILDEASASVAEALAGDAAQALGRGSEALTEREAEPLSTAEIAPHSADLWQVASTTRGGDEDLALEPAPLLDREELRSLVLDLIRQELQGPLGERITRNVRKLVRREINRALESRDLD